MMNCRTVHNYQINLEKKISLSEQFRYLVTLGVRWLYFQKQSFGGILKELI